MRTAPAILAVPVVAALWACHPKPPAASSAPSAPSALKALSIADAPAPANDAIPLVTGNGYPPFTDESLPGRGLATTVVETIFRANGIPFTLTFLPWNRAEKGTESGRYLGTFPYVRTPEREALFDYSDPIYRVLVQVYVPKGKSFELNHPAGLAGKSVCKPQGYALEDDLKPLVESGKLKLESPADLDTCIKMMKAGRVDTVTENNIVFWDAVQRLYGTTNDFEALPYPLADNRLYFIVSKKHPDGQRILDLFNKALRDLKKAGTLPHLDTL